MSPRMTGSAIQPAGVAGHRRRIIGMSPLRGHTTLLAHRAAHAGQATAALRLDAVMPKNLPVRDRSGGFGVTNVAIGQRIANANVHRRCSGSKG